MQCPGDGRVENVYRLGADHRLVTADFTALLPRRLGRADVAFCPVNSVRHLPEDRDVLAHFESTAADLLGSVKGKRPSVGRTERDAELLNLAEEEPEITPPPRPATTPW